MSTIKISIQEMSEKNGWINVKTTDGKELSILTKEGKNPKTKAILDNAKEGQTVELPAKIVEKDGKNYVWDADDKKGGFGGKGFAPKDKSFDAGIAAANAAGAMLALTKGATPTDFDTLFDHIHKRIMSKVTATAPSTETNK